MTGIHDNRLTDQDRGTIRRAVRETVAHWNYGRGPANSYVPQSTDYLTLERIGHHAIGCTDADLRESELAEIAALARDEANIPRKATR
jgi:hypothetical protein